jgi:hypothetical protein
MSGLLERGIRLQLELTDLRVQLLQLIAAVPGPVFGPAEPTQTPLSLGADAAEPGPAAGSNKKEVPTLTETWDPCEPVNCVAQGTRLRLMSLQRCLTSSIATDLGR